MRKGFLAVASLLLAGSVSLPALAEDDILTDAPEIEISDSPEGGWYVRADLRYAPWIREGDPYSVDTGTGARTSFDESRFSKPFSGGIGFGHQFNDMFRADLTADFSRGDFDGTSFGAAPCAATEPAGTSCRYGHAGSYRSMALMANGYVDFATFAGFTPYLGVGVGATRVHWNDMSISANCVAGGAACVVDDHGSSAASGESSWRFTYALSAGASYEFQNGMKLDVGYRFTDVAGGDMFSSADANGRDDGFQRHEFRVGLRLSIW